MSKLQKANLGVAPSGSGGDDQRTANLRFNANVDVLKSHLPLEYTILSDDAKLESSQVGTRFSVVMKAPGKTVAFPLASSVEQNASLHFFNLGPAFSIGLQPGDGTPVNVLNTGDWAEWASDGGTYWHIVRRGRLLWDETVGGFLTVGMGLTVGGDVKADGRMRSTGLTVDGSAVVGGGISTPVISFSQGLKDGVVRIYNNGGEYNVVIQTGPPGKEQWAVFDPTGVLRLPARPTWFAEAAVVPWDSGNLKNPMTLDSEQGVSGVKRFLSPTYYGKQVTINASEQTGHWTTASLVVAGYPGNGSIGIGSANAAINIRCAAASETLDVLSYNTSTFAQVAAKAFNVNSDEAIKAEIETIENATEKIKRLRGVTYVMKSDENPARQLGVIAQEVAKVFPEAVTETGIRIDESGVTVKEGGRPMLAVNYSALVGPLIQAFIELEARVAAMEG
ncbi:tail fiber domain-containing protein [Burkholderia theae]|uniref:tail fiber domain-containing protein n=1 Tax=Burkholderia theae TaxID=3143496 RepID=UPI003AFA4EC2